MPLRSRTITGVTITELNDENTALSSARRQGHAGVLLKWVDDEARRLGCAGVHLDSGTHRHDAHRLYLGSGYVIPAFHFSKAI